MLLNHGKHGIHGTSGQSAFSISISQIDANHKKCLYLNRLHRNLRLSHSLQMLGTGRLRNEAYIEVRRSDEAGR
jgi:hypothetical protein